MEIVRSMYDPIRLDEQIAHWRSRYAKGRLDYRRASEAEARALIADGKGAMTRAQAELLLRKIRSDLTALGQEESGRFGSGLKGKNEQLLLGDLALFNRWAWALFTAEDVAAALCDYWAAEVPGGKNLFPTAVLNLRDPERFAYLTHQLEKGLRRLFALPNTGSTPNDLVVRYHHYNKAVALFRATHHVSAVEVDILLDLIANLEEVPAPAQQVAPDFLRGVDEATAEQALCEADDEEFAHFLNTANPAASYEEKQGIIRRRTEDRAVLTRLKERYNHQCQICGWGANEFGAHVVEAHHIRPLSQSLDNSPRNIVIVCPNHHRLLHVVDATLDRKSGEFVGKNGYRAKLLRDDHLLA